MSYHWEPQWIRKRVVVDGMELEVCQDLSTGLYLCPLCIDIDRVCPSESKPSTVVPDKATYFFSLQDLVRHLHAHRESRWREAAVSVEEEAEEEFVSGEEE